MALYARDARASRSSTSRILFVYGNPEWKPIATAYLGLLLLGGCFISLGLFISSLTKNQIVAGDRSPSRCSCSSGSSTGSAASRDRRSAAITTYLSIIDHFDDFCEGRHRHDASHLLPELHHVRPVSDRQVGRQRTVARLMANRIFSIIGWLGTALVVGAVGDPLRPAGAGAVRLLPGLRRASPACCSTSLSQWREIAQHLLAAGRRATARWRARASSSCSASSSRSTTSASSRTSAGI